MNKQSTHNQTPAGAANTHKLRITHGLIALGATGLSLFLLRYGWGALGEAITVGGISTLEGPALLILALLCGSTGLSAGVVALSCWGEVFRRPTIITDEGEDLAELEWVCYQGHASEHEDHEGWATFAREYEAHVAAEEGRGK